MIATTTENLLSVESLTIDYASRNRMTTAVRDVTFAVPPGKAVALVGESGSGKSTCARAIVRLLPRPAAHIRTGRVVFEGRDLSTLETKELEKIRGTEIGLVMQQSLNCLDPTMRVITQIRDSLHRDKAISRHSANAKAYELLARTGIPDPPRVGEAYPFELSGGMRQRIAIAIALIGEPKLLIADEPTTALDVTTQAQIIELLGELTAEMSMALLLITHDLGVVAGLGDIVYVMYAGSVVESGNIRDVFYGPQHPYTRALLASTPRLHAAAADESSVSAGEGVRPSLEGCAYAPRCPERVALCETQVPRLAAVSETSQEVACWVRTDSSQPDPTESH